MDIAEDGLLKIIVKKKSFFLFYFTIYLLKKDFRPIPKSASTISLKKSEILKLNGVFSQKEEFLTITPINISPHQIITKLTKNK